VGAPDWRGGYHGVSSSNWCEDDPLGTSNWGRRDHRGRSWLAVTVLSTTHLEDVPTPKVTGGSTLVLVPALISSSIAAPESTSKAAPVLSAGIT
jgi:hypothetical protein